MPFAIHVEYLTGYAVAATSDGSAEWPPHPARLFMALVAAVYETGGDARQLAALRWLEQQAPPTVYASKGFERTQPDVFVPPNDAESPRKAASVKDKDVFAKMLVLPQYRTNRQPRTFARFRPDEPMVTFAWSADPGEHAQALAEACRAVARVGHSASLVQCWLDQGEWAQSGRERWDPDDLGEHRLRMFNEGTLQDLDERYNREAIEAYFAHPPRPPKRGEEPPAPPPRIRPAMRAAIGYRRAGSLPMRGTVFDPRPYVFKLEPIRGKTTYRFLSAATGPDLCARMRDALLSKAGDDSPAILSGHNADGSPLREPHVAIMPLADVGRRHSGGHLLGLAVVLPREMDRGERMKVMQALGQVEVLRQVGVGGVLGDWSVKPVDVLEQRKGLQAETWSAADKGAKCWATVTPISLDRHTKSKDAAGQQEEIAAIIRFGCEQVGLPEPNRVVPFPVSPFPGAPNGYDYPRLRRKDGSRRRQTHAMLWFDEPIVGPVILGAGRFRGWGVCRPFQERQR